MHAYFSSARRSGGRTTPLKRPQEAPAEHADHASPLKRPQEAPAEHADHESPHANEQRVKRPRLERPISPSEHLALLSLGTAPPSLTTLAAVAGLGGVLASFLSPRELLSLASTSSAWRQAARSAAIHLRAVSYADLVESPLLPEDGADMRGVRELDFRRYVASTAEQPHSRQQQLSGRQPAPAVFPIFAASSLAAAAAPAPPELAIDDPSLSLSQASISSSQRSVGGGARKDVHDWPLAWARSLLGLSGSGGRDLATAGGERAAQGPARPGLERLSLGLLVPARFACAALGACAASLTHLHLRDCEWLTDAHACALPGLPRLAVLDVSGCRRLSGHGLLALAERAPSLRRASVARLPRAGGADILGAFCGPAAAAAARRGGTLSLEALEVTPGPLVTNDDVGALVRHAFAGAVSGATSDADANQEPPGAARLETLALADAWLSEQDWIALLRATALAARGAALAARERVPASPPALRRDAPAAFAASRAGREQSGGLRPVLAVALVRPCGLSLPALAAFFDALDAKGRGPLFDALDGSAGGALVADEGEDEDVDVDTNMTAAPSSPGGVTGAAAPLRLLLDAPVRALIRADESGAALACDLDTALMVEGRLFLGNGPQPGRS